MASGELCTCRMCREKPINQGLWVVSEEHRAVLERAQAQNAALMAVLEAATECVAIINRQSDRWEVAEVEYRDVEGLRRAIKEARATLEARP